MDRGSKLIPLVIIGLTITGDITTDKEFAIISKSLSVPVTLKNILVSSITVQAQNYLGFTDVLKLNSDVDQIIL